MNPVLAQLYGTGFEKTASEYDDELDLDSISAADFLALLDDEDDFEKEAFDLSNLSAAELMELWEEAEALEGGDALEKMAADGSLDYFDTAGRIMAHAYADEMDKVAGPDEIDVDLDEISGEDLLELMEAGYEFVDFEKEAGVKEMKAAGMTARQIRRALKAQSQIKRPTRTVTTKSMRKARSAARKAQPEMYGKGSGSIAARRKAEKASRQTGKMRSMLYRMKGSGGGREFLKARPGMALGGMAALSGGSGVAAADAYNKRRK